MRSMVRHSETQTGSRKHGRYLGEPNHILADHSGRKIGLMVVQMYSTAWCRDCRATKSFLDEHGISYTEIDIDSNPAAAEEVVRQVGKRAIPQLVIDGEWFQPYAPGQGLLYDELYERLQISRLIAR
jgi:glutaredoxin